MSPVTLLVHLFLIPDKSTVETFDFGTIASERASVCVMTCNVVFGFEGTASAQARIMIGLRW